MFWTSQPWLLAFGWSFSTHYSMFSSILGFCPLYVVGLPCCGKQKFLQILSNVLWGNNHPCFLPLPPSPSLPTWTESWSLCSRTTWFQCSTWEPATRHSETKRKNAESSKIVQNSIYWAAARPDKSLWYGPEDETDKVVRTKVTSFKVECTWFISSYHQGQTHSWGQSLVTRVT